MMLLIAYPPNLPFGSGGQPIHPPKGSSDDQRNFRTFICVFSAVRLNGQVHFPMAIVPAFLSNLKKSRKLNQQIIRWGESTLTKTNVTVNVWICNHYICYQINTPTAMLVIGKMC